jgi:cytidine deaminase
MDFEELIKKAKAAQTHSYSPYSNFKVGSALLSKDGAVFVGSNIENSSYSTTICAERCAIFKAVSEGQRDFNMLVLVSESKDLSPPCGSCLQVISEFCDGSFKIVLANSSTQKRVYLLKNLLPQPFKIK